VSNLRSFAFCKPVASSYASPSLVRRWGGPPLLERMRTTTLHHVAVIEDLATLRAAMSSTVERLLGRSTDGTFRMKVMSELVGQFQRLEEF
jgi:hypothetical protein